MTKAEYILKFLAFVLNFSNRPPNGTSTPSLIALQSCKSRKYDDAVYSIDDGGCDDADDGDDYDNEGVNTIY